MASNPKTKTFRPACGVALVSACCLGPMGCGGDADAPATVVPRPVKALVLKGSAQPMTRTYPGEVRADRSVELAFQVTGRLIEFPVSKGQKVRRGDLLAKLDPQDFQHTLDAKQAVLSQSRARRDRLAAAAKTGAVSAQQLTDAEAALAVAEAEVRIAAKALADTELHAPFDAVVGNTFPDNFEFITAREAVVSLQNVDRIEIHVAIPEADMAGVEATNVGTMTAAFPVLPGQSFPLTVKEFVAEADPITQTFDISLAMPAPEPGVLLPGMTARVTWQPPVVSDAEPTHSIPANAVLDGPTPGAASVWIIDPATMTTRRRAVALGSVTSDGEVEVLTGLLDGDVVALSAVQHLRDGTSVRATVADTAQLAGDTP